MKAVRQSIKGEVAINERDCSGNTALHLAALNLGADTVALLLQAGAEPNATNK